MCMGVVPEAVALLAGCAAWRMTVQWHDRRRFRKRLICSFAEQNLEFVPFSGEISDRLMVRAVAQLRDNGYEVVRKPDDPEMTLWGRSGNNTEGDLYIDGPVRLWPA